jgi:hypothetical protein
LSQKPQYPAIWDLFETCDIAETPMHLGSGVQRAALKSTMHFCAGRSKKTDFVRRSNEVLDLLQKLHVDLCPVISFKDEKFGGYVAENYSAVTMVVGWVSRVLQEASLQPGVPDVVPDPSIKNVKNWTGKDCKAWLKERGLNTSMNAEDAKKIVSNYLTGPQEQIPEIVTNLVRELDPARVRYFLLNANSVFGTIMANDLTAHQAKNRSQACIALFLSIYESLDEVLMPNRSKPIWIEKYNILGLLRVPNHFLRFGLFRNLYEGGEVGEGAVKHLRKLCPQGVRKGWSENMIDKYYRERSMRGLLAEANVFIPTSEDLPNPVMDLGPEPDNLSRTTLKKFRRYKGLPQLKAYFTAGWPVSVIICKHPTQHTFRFGCLVRKDSQVWTIHQIKERHNDSVDDHLGYRYCSISLEERGKDIPSKQLPTMDGFLFHSYGVMLPDLWTDQIGNEFRRYAFVGENWERLEQKDSWTRIL